MVATTEATEWRGRVLPAGTGILIFAPFFHRDGDRLPFAETFRPAIWLHGEAVDWPLVPFSQGPAECPGRGVVLLLTSWLLATLLAELDLGRPEPVPLGPSAPLPATLSPFRLRLPVAP